VKPELRIDTRDVTVEQAADLVMSVIESMSRQASVGVSKRHRLAIDDARGRAV
jgi:hypothetical protein